MSDRHYLSCADTAKLVRKALKNAFPGVKFSVRSDTYAGGASIDVKWTDGPTAREVDSVIKMYSGSGFDGMQDLKYSYDHWLMPDGSVKLAKSYHNMEPFEAPKPEDGARLVSFGADFVFSHRSTSKALMVKGVEHALANYAMGDAFWAKYTASGLAPADLVVEHFHRDGTPWLEWNREYANLRAGNYWVSDVFYQATSALRGDGTAAYDRYGHNIAAAEMQADAATV